MPQLLRKPIAGRRPRQVAKDLGVGGTTVYKLIASKELRAINVAPPGARRPRFIIGADDLAEFLTIRATTPPKKIGRPRKNQADPST